MWPLMNDKRRFRRRKVALNGGLSWSELSYVASGQLRTALRR
jgi:hypothetical protein